MLIYGDSMILIYLLDAVGPWNVRAASRIADMCVAGDTAALSDLSRLECRVQPLRLGATKTLADMDAFFRRPDIHFAPISTAVPVDGQPDTATPAYRRFSTSGAKAGSVRRVG